MPGWRGCQYVLSLCPLKTVLILRTPLNAHNYIQVGCGISCGFENNNNVHVARDFIFHFITVVRGLFASPAIGSLTS